MNIRPQVRVTPAQSLQAFISKRPAAAPPSAQGHRSQPTEMRQGERPAGHLALHVNLDRLVVAGISRAEQARMTHALQQRLASLLRATRDRDWSVISGVDRVDGGTLPVGATPEQIGRHIADCILAGLETTKER